MSIEGAPRAKEICDPLIAPRRDRGHPQRNSGNFAIAVRESSCKGVVVGLLQRRNSVLLACALLAVTAVSASAAGHVKRHGERVCDATTGRVASCGAEVLANSGGAPLATTSYQSRYAPNDLRSA